MGGRAHLVQPPRQGPRRLCRVREGLGELLRQPLLEAGQQDLDVHQAGGALQHVHQQVDGLDAVRLLLQFGRRPVQPDIALLQRVAVARERLLRQCAPRAGVGPLDKLIAGGCATAGSGVATAAGHRGRAAARHLALAVEQSETAMR